MHNNIAVCPLACPAGTFGFQGKHFLVIYMELLGFREEGGSLGVEEAPEAALHASTYTGVTRRGSTIDTVPLN